MSFIFKIRKSTIFVDNQQPSVNYRSIKKNALKYHAAVDDVYGVYKVLSPHESGKALWVCEHIYTQKQGIYRGAYLHHLKKRVDNKSKANQLGLRKYMYRNYIQNSKSRGHQFHLTFDDFTALTSQPCVYCGTAPQEASAKLIIHKGDTFQYPLYYNGIDRIDSNLDYSIDNCVSCCSLCNMMKHIQPVDVFLKQVELIYNYSLNKGSTTIPKGSTLQANGGGNGELLTSKAEDEDIVSTL